MADLTSEIDGIKCDNKNAITFAYFDSLYKVSKLVSKLPFGHQE